MLRAYKDYRNLCDDIFYWSPSDRNTLEVDFILIRGSEIMAVEVITGKTLMRS